MRTFFKITVAIALLVSLGFTYIAAKETKVKSEVLKKSKTQKEAIVGGDNIKRETYKLVHKKLVKPYNAKTTKEPHGKMFSRCPSGNRARVKKTAAKEDGYSYGEMRYYKGCESNKMVCKFRARLSDNSVDVLLSDSINYIAADLWIDKATVSEIVGSDKESAQN